MCMTCGCLLPNVCHHFDDDYDCADILLFDLERAAGAAGVSVPEAANNIPRTLRQASGTGAAQSFDAMLNRPTLFVDIDNVLCDLSSAVCVALNAAFNTDYRTGDFEVYSWASVLPSPQVAWLKNELNGHKLYQNVSPVQLAVNTVKRAKQAGYTVKLVTDRLPSTEETTLEWLWKYDVPFDTIGFRLIGGSKLSYLDGYDESNPAVLIDDNPTYLHLAPRPGVQAWTPRLPYTPELTNIRIFDDWHEVRRWLGV